MKSQNDMSSDNERDQALTILDANISRLILIYKECYLSMGRGALLVYSQDILSGKLPNKIDYRPKTDMLEVFDDPNSQAKLGGMINHYNMKTEGVMALITSQSNATFFVTCKFK